MALPADLMFEGGNNDTPATATPLPLTEDPVGSGLFKRPGLGRQDPLTNYAWESDPDYWRFEALAGDIVSVSVDTPNSVLNPYVWLCNSAGSSVAGDDNYGPDADALISHYTIPAERHLLRGGGEVLSRNHPGQLRGSGGTWPGACSRRPTANTATTPSAGPTP